MEKHEDTHAQTRIEKIFEIVEFPSQGATLRGRLYIPNKSKNNPVVIMAHGFSATINGMTANRYAETFNNAGLAVLLYDHRNFGISDGEPRQEINMWVQARGYIDAINFVSTLPEINTEQIGIWGCSLSSGEILIVGSVDDRVKAIVGQATAYGDNPPLEDKDGSLFSFIKKTVLNDNIMELPHKITGPMPVVSSDQICTPSALVELTAFRWFIEYGGRYGTNWQNTVTLASIDAPDLLHVGQCAPHLKAPILMVVASFDEMEGASTDISREVFDMVTQPKELLEVDGGHFGLLHYPSKIFDISSKAQTSFLKKHLT
jgi:cephalosporin-C deacetylase-like acetyl esterase